MNYNPIIYYGSPDTLPRAVPLRAGNLSLLYENGALRYIKYGKDEVIRMIYPAVRDRNWETAMPLLTDELINHNENSFSISFTCHYKHNDIDFTTWNIISGSSEGKLIYKLRGRANSTFLKNRIGLCVLHPLKECVGKECIVKEIDGKTCKSSFPYYISPHQPFKNIASISWNVNENCRAGLDFKGDVFEMEDHRNWTDASFKIYSTPLEMPFPVEVKRGEVMEQTVELTVEADPIHRTARIRDIAKVHYDDRGIPFPSIGIGANQKESLTPAQRDWVIQAGFDHIRVEIDLSIAGWKILWDKKIRELELLALPMELVLITDDQYEEQLDSFSKCLPQANAGLDAILLFHKDHKTTPDELLITGRKVLGKLNIRYGIGGGTNAYFTELNRQGVDPNLVDFVAFSINPQVHASDNRSITETCEAQWWTIKSAKEYYGNLPVRVTPVTLKPRFNPNATGEEPIHDYGELPPEADVRQMSLFGAAWTMRSIKNLALAGAAGVSFFNTAGLCGIMDSAEIDPVRQLFIVPENSIFPVYHVLRQILEMKSGVMLPADSPDPLEWDLLVMKEGNRIRIIVANFTSINKKIELPVIYEKYNVNYLNESAFPDVWHDAAAFNVRDFLFLSEANTMTINLRPFGIAFLDGVGE